MEENEEIDLMEILSSQAKQWSTTTLQKSERIDVSKQNLAYIVLQGQVVAFDKRTSNAGTKETVTLKRGDPVGFAEALAFKEPIFDYVAGTPAKLLEVSALKLRDEVSKANVLATTIIRYVVNRIFDDVRSSKNYLFEDEFVNKNKKIFLLTRYSPGERIFSSHSNNLYMYFIRHGQVEIASSKGERLGLLEDGECFGESAVITKKERTLDATALTNVETIAIEKSVVLRELKKNSELVQLTSWALLKRLEIMNELKLKSSENQ